MRNVFFGLFLVLVLESALFAGWTWTEGGDGQRIVYPTSGWTWTEGRDGRRVVYPSSGWTWTEGRDGRRVIYPSSGWTWTEGGDGRRVVYPSSGSAGPGPKAATAGGWSIPPAAGPGPKGLTAPGSSTLPAAGPGRNWRMGIGSPIRSVTAPFTLPGISSWNQCANMFRHRTNPTWACSWTRCKSCILDIMGTTASCSGSKVCTKTPPPARARWGTPQGTGAPSPGRVPADEPRPTGLLRQVLRDSTKLAVNHSTNGLLEEELTLTPLVPVVPWPAPAGASTPRAGLTPIEASAALA